MFHLDGDTLNLAEYSVTFRDNGRLHFGHYTNAIILKGINSINYSHGHFYPPSGLSMILQGEVCLWKDVEIVGNLYVQDSLSLVSTYSAGDNKFNVRGNLKNAGTIFHEEGTSPYEFEIEGNLTNCGLFDIPEKILLQGDLDNTGQIEVESVEMIGEISTQHICLTSASPIHSEVNLWPDNLPAAGGGLIWYKDGTDSIGNSFVYSFPELTFDDFGTYHAVKNGLSTRDIIIGSTSLPVELVSFTTTYLGNYQVSLNWESSSEINNDFYLIKRSTDGIVWEDISTVASNGNGLISQFYEITDEVEQGGDYYYRLVQVDFGGTKEELATSTIQIDFEDLLIFPNPPNGFLNIDSPNATKVVFMDINGKQIFQSPTANRQHQINTSFLQKGIYFLLLEDAFGQFMKLEKISILD